RLAGVVRDRARAVLELQRDHARPRPGRHALAAAGARPFARHVPADLALRGAGPPRALVTVRAAPVVVARRGAAVPVVSAARAVVSAVSLVAGGRHGAVRARPRAVSVPGVRPAACPDLGRVVSRGVVRSCLPLLRLTRRSLVRPTLARGRVLLRLARWHPVRGALPRVLLRLARGGRPLRGLAGRGLRFLGLAGRDPVRRGLAGRGLLFLGLARRDAVLLRQPRRDAVLLRQPRRDAVLLRQP